MIQSQSQTDFSHLLGADEKVLWQGPISFNILSSPVFTVALMVTTGFTIWALAGYAPDQSGDNSRAQFVKLAARPMLIATLAFQVFVMLERRALSLGRAKGAVILTDRRLIRICDWPKLRLRAHDYHRKRMWGFGGVIMFGELGLVTLERQDADQIRNLIQSQSKVPA